MSKKTHKSYGAVLGEILNRLDDLTPDQYIEPTTPPDHDYRVVCDATGAIKRLYTLWRQIETEKEGLVLKGAAVFGSAAESTKQQLEFVRLSCMLDLFSILISLEVESRHPDLANGGETIIARGWKLCVSNNHPSQQDMLQGLRAALLNAGGKPPGKH